VKPVDTVRQAEPNTLPITLSTFAEPKRLTPDYGLVIAPVSLIFPLDKVFKTSASHG
jgi:hypothetical protein